MAESIRVHIHIVQHQAAAEGLRFQHSPDGGAILIAQLATAAAIDAFGIMGTEKLAFGWSKWAGLALMTGGVLLFKMK